MRYGAKHRLSAGLLMLLSGGLAWGVPSPVPFGHRRHVEKQLGCTFCHAGATRQARAGMPGVTLCMSCHSVVKKDSPGVVRAREYRERGEEIPWRSVCRIPAAAAVFFNHRRHAAAGLGCAKCHGPVEKSDELRQEVQLTMAFCVTCHRESRATFHDPRMADDCGMCHR